MPTADAILSGTSEWLSTPSTASPSIALKGNLLLPATLARRSYSKPIRSEEHTSELQSLMRISYAVFCLKKKNTQHKHYKSLYSLPVTNTHHLYHISSEPY